MSSLKIACLGEVMIEMIVDADGKNAALGVAGDIMNTAIYLSRGLVKDHEIAFVSMIGRDPLSDRIETFIASEGVSTKFLKRHPTRLPGLYSISTNEAGERSFSYWRDASAARLMYASSEDAGFEELSNFDVIFMSAISLAILPRPVRDRFYTWLKDFRADGGKFVFDSNYRPALWPDKEEARYEITRAWSHCDIALPSVDDEMALFGDSDEDQVLKRLRTNGVRLGVLKRGELGPWPIDKGEVSAVSFAPAIKVIDTTAAGDSFNGGFLATYLTTGDLAEAMKAGHDLANRVIGHRGAIIPR